MDKLTYLETLEAEKQEKIRAKRQALLQENQRQKRLWYLPIILEFVVFAIALCAMYLLIFSAGFIT